MVVDSSISFESLRSEVLYLFTIEYFRECWVNENISFLCG